MQTTMIDIKRIKPNSGQVQGLPKNPRFCKDDAFKNMVKSVMDFPEMLELRECIVFPFGKDFIIVGGERRFRACVELKLKTVPCKVLAKNTPVERLRAYALKDNTHAGDWDFELLANEWDEQELLDSGIDLPDVDLAEIDDEDEEDDEENQVKAQIVHCPKCKHEFSIMKEK